MVIEETGLYIPGDEGFLESRFVDLDSDLLLVVCHPHPLHGGTMHNKVVTTVCRAFQQLNCSTLRFNFRGVGSSQGSYGHGVGEISDLTCVLEWVRQNRPNVSVCLAGFSFGAYVALRSTHHPLVRQLITIAPAVTHFDVHQIPDIHQPWLLVMGEEDEVVSVSAVRNWVAHLKHPPKTVYVAGAGHFFHGKLIELKEILIKLNCFSKNGSKLG